MITASTAITNMISAPVRSLIAEVELYKGSTLVKTFKHDDKLVKVTVERAVEENKFFGVGICQHAIVNILDREREIDFITTEYSMKIKMGIEGELIYPFPTFYITQTRRDENTNALSIYGYDLIKKASTEKIGSHVSITASQTVRGFADSCAAGLNSSIVVQGVKTGETCFHTRLSTGVNFEGSEALREGLNDIAEVTQTIYFVNSEDKIVFKRLQKDTAEDLLIDKSKYFTLETKANKRLGKIHHTTVLGDNVYATAAVTGTTQFVRDNGIWTNVTNLGTLLQNAINAYGGISIGQFDCYWRGNFLLEIGDRIGLVTKDNDTIYSYLLDDVIEYDGTYSQRTKWAYNDDTNEEEGGNPATLGEIISQTYAKVDKAAGQIELVAKKTDELEDKVSSIVLDADGINSTVQRIEKNIDDIEGEMNTFESQIEQTADALNLKVSKNEIISAINLSPESIDISSDKINLTGYVTFNDLKNKGSTVINGSNITTGTISADRINMTGAIGWSDLDSFVQGEIEAGGSSGAVPSYIKSTYIDSVEIRSPAIKGNEIKVYNTFQTVNNSGLTTGYMGAARGMDAAGNTTYGVAMSNEWSSDSYNVGEQYVIVTNAGVRMQSGDNDIVVTPDSINLTAHSGSIHLSTPGGGKVYYNGIEVGGVSGSVVPVWG